MAPTRSADVLRCGADAHQQAGSEDKREDAKRAGHASISDLASFGILESKLRAASIFSTAVIAAPQMSPPNSLNLRGSMTLPISMSSATIRDKISYMPRKHNERRRLVSGRLRFRGHLCSSLWLRGYARVIRLSSAMPNGLISAPAWLEAVEH
jgi:hypothetical protein